MSLVHCKLPQAGLGNQLFPLLKAGVFARINHLPLTVTNYHQVRIGPYLRGEKSKRNYNHYFKFQKPVFGERFDRWAIGRKSRSHTVVEEPGLKELPGAQQVLYRFSQIPHWNDYFNGLRDHRPAAITILKEMIRPEIWEQVERFDAPSIGIHIRMGDFRRLAPGENFAKVGTVRTPGDYFVGVIRQIRSVLSDDLPVSIFSDGRRQELDGIVQLPGVELVEGNADIVDMLLLSRSKIIVTSAGSTFGYWAGFLSEAPMIMHPEHIHQPVRISGDGQDLYEGPLNDAAMGHIQSIYSKA